VNIFYLDRDPSKAAKQHCDKHVVKMILETAQLLSTAIQSKGVTDPLLYRSTHLNHPSSIWVRENAEQFRWACSLGINLCKEYTARYGKVHKSTEVLLAAEKYLHLFPAGEFKDPPQCMPDECKDKDTVVAYKKYYIMKKQSFATWKTKTPNWFKTGVSK
jgi:hypothetical protein